MIQALVINQLKHQCSTTRNKEKYLYKGIHTNITQLPETPNV